MMGTQVPMGLAPQSSPSPIRPFFPSSASGELWEPQLRANCSHTRGSETSPVIGRLQLEICRTATYDISVLSEASARQIWHALAIFIKKISILPPPRSFAKPADKPGFHQLSQDHIGHQHDRQQQPVQRW